MGQRIRVSHCSTSFLQRELPDSLSSSSSNISGSWQWCRTHVYLPSLLLLFSRLLPGYLDMEVMFWCPMCSLPPGSRSFIDSRQLLLRKGQQTENSEVNEARIPSLQQVQPATWRLHTCSSLLTLGQT